MIRLADIQGLDLDAALELVGQIVQQGAGSPTADGTDDIPAFLQKLGGHGVAETTGGSNEQNGLGQTGHPWFVQREPI